MKPRLPQQLSDYHPSAPRPTVSKEENGEAKGIVPCTGAIFHSDQDECSRLELCRQFIAQKKVPGVFFAPLDLTATNDQTNQAVVSLLEKAGIPIVLLDRGFLPYPERSSHDLVSIAHRSPGTLPPISCLNSAVVASADRYRYLPVALLRPPILCGKSAPSGRHGRLELPLTYPARLALPLRRPAREANPPPSRSRGPFFFLIPSPKLFIAGAGGRPQSPPQQPPDGVLSGGSDGGFNAGLWKRSPEAALPSRDIKLEVWRADLDQLRSEKPCWSWFYAYSI